MPLEETLSIPQLSMALTTNYGLRAVCSLFVMTFSWYLSNHARRKLRELLDGPDKHLDPTLVKFASNLVRWGIITGTALAILSVFGVQVASFAALLGAVGFTVGMAFQGTLSNFASGVMLMIFRPFKVGDSIKVAGQHGRVDEIDIFTTTLDTDDNRRIIVPNGIVVGAIIENESVHDEKRMDIGLSVPAFVPVESLIAEVQGILSDIKLIEGFSAPRVVVVAVSVTATHFRLEVWANRAQAPAIHHRLLIDLRAALNRVSAAATRQGQLDADGLLIRHGVSPAEVGFLLEGLDPSQRAPLSLS